VTDGNHRWKTVGCGCCAGVLLVGCLCAVALVAGTKRLVAYGIESDVKDYIRLVELADIDEGTRQELLDRLERIRVRALRGDVGFFAWVSHDESLDELAEDGTLTDLEAAAFERELDRLEHEFDGTPQPEPEPADADRPLVRASDEARGHPRDQGCSVPSLRIPT
jgi:hypothetical protein